MKLPLDKGCMPDKMPMTMPTGGLVTCHNVYPMADHYSPVPTISAYAADAVTGTPLGMAEFRSSNGLYQIIIGDTTDLYRLQSDLTLDTVTGTSGPYTSGDNRWSMVQYGDWIVATNYADPPQVLKGVDSASTFEDLGGSPPHAKYCLLYNGHLIFANTIEASVTYPKRLRWSAFEDIEDYTVSRTTGADYQDITDADGDITGLARVGNKFAVFCENSITIGWYSGPPYTFTMPPNKFKGIGGIPGTMVSVGDLCYFWSRDDMLVTNGETCQSLGEAVRDTVTGNLNYTKTHLISVMVDMTNHVIVWSYPSSTSEIPDRLLIYNYEKQRFATADMECYCLCPIHVGGSDLDSMDSAYPSVDAIPYSIDSSYWMPNAIIPGCVSSDGYVSLWTGAPSTAVIETGDWIQDPEGGILSLSNVRPMVQGSGATTTVSVGHKLAAVDDVTYTTDATVGSVSGRALCRAVGRYLRLKFTVSSFTKFGLACDADVVKVAQR